MAKKIITLTAGESTIFLFPKKSAITSTKTQRTVPDKSPTVNDGASFRKLEIKPHAIAEKQRRTADIVGMDLV
jgi:hypothetical protein